MLNTVNSLVGQIAGIGKRQAQLQLATRRDIPDILRLYYKEGWVDYSHDDFAFLFDSSADCCFKLTVDGRLVGVSLATIASDEICYPHSNLIDSDYRDKINYFDEAIKYNEYLKTIGRLQILYASRRVVRLYQTGGGFTPLTWYRRAVVQAKAAACADGTVEVDAGRWDAVYRYTRSIYHASREPLFRHFVAAGARGFAVVQPSGEIEAFALVRRLPKGIFIGPVLAESAALARRVIAAALAQHPGQELIVEGEEKKLAQMLAGAFDVRWEDNMMMKMYRGDAALLEDETRLHGIFSRYIS
jgi:hypothetical protein